MPEIFCPKTGVKGNNWGLIKQNICIISGAQFMQRIYFRGHILCDEFISDGTMYAMNLFQRAEFM